MRKAKISTIIMCFALCLAFCVVSAGNTYADVWGPNSSPMTQSNEDEVFIWLIVGSLIISTSIIITLSLIKKSKSPTKNSSPDAATTSVKTPTENQIHGEKENE